MSERFSLKWSDFQSVVSQSFSVLRQEADFYDVTLVIDDHTQISAHKLVLSASSDLFKSILRKNHLSHPLLYLSGVDSTSLGFVLDYIYQGEVQIYQEDLDSFLEVAERLKIQGLPSVDDLENANEESFHLKIELTEEEGEVRRVHSEKTVVITDMAEVEEKIQELIERRDGSHHCLACDYRSSHTGHIREHVERHIQGLQYPCQFCQKILQSRSALRNHSRRCKQKQCCSERNFWFHYP